MIKSAEAGVQAIEDLLREVERGVSELGAARQIPLISQIVQGLPAALIALRVLEMVLSSLERATAAPTASPSSAEPSVSEPTPPPNPS